MSRRWFARIGGAAAVWLGVVLVALFFGSTFQPLVLALVVFAVASVMGLVMDASAFAQPSYWTQARNDPVRSPGEDRRLDALVRHLDKNFDAKESSDLIHEDLVAVADERLMAVHGFSRAHDPERAAAVLGPDLAQFLADPRHGRKPLTLQQIENILNRIESL